MLITFINLLRLVVFMVIGRVKREKISCIVPAYNEGERIGGVLRILEKSPFIDEIIVVDDASTDNTSEVARRFKRVRLIRHKKNKRKTAAVIGAVKIAKYPLIMLIDADLIGLSLKDIENLAEPVVLGEADMSVSLRGNSLRIFKMWGLDFVSGERVFKKTLFGNLNDFKKLPGFGLESFLNSKVIKKGLRVKVVLWPGVSHARKAEKMGFFRGQKEDVSMFFQIVRVLGVRGIFYQIRKLRKLRV